ncbi:UNVERIFIED_CONTAM: Gamma-glutamyl peptidase 5 [Sesamum latifolium]|uniref:Gamma-glutamyl peptidase 5 n=1 Tax=Sesamum latifolium TaxID=2727402 RepID=A0AAW2XJZ2_9LAMI
MEGRKFAVLLCAEDSDYVMSNYGGYHGVYVRMLKEEGETWEEFKVARGELPADDEIAEYDGFVITGSCSDADSNEVWICKLVVLLRRLDAMKKKILGICFGHQVTELPREAEILGWSKKTGVEMFTYGGHIMGIQGHPEYTKDILLHLIDRLSNDCLIEVSLAKDAKLKLEAVEPDREAWKKLCTSFLKGRL